MGKWAFITVPQEFKKEMEQLKQEINKYYGFNLSYWEFIAYLMRFYKQNKKYDR